MASNDFCIKVNDDDKCCDSNELCCTNENIQVAFRSGKQQLTCGDTALDVDKICQSSILSSEVPRHGNDELTGSSEKLVRCNEFEKERCFEEKECVEKMSAEKSGLCCNKGDIGKEEEIENTANAINAGNEDCSHYSVERKEKGFESVVGDKADCCDTGIELKGERSAVCLESCSSSKQSELATNRKSQANVNETAQCCEQSSSCSSEISSKACSSGEKRFKVSLIADHNDCCAVKDSHLDESNISANNKTSDFERKKTCCNKIKTEVGCGQEFTAKPTSCCEAVRRESKSNSSILDAVLSEENDECCESTSLISKDSKETDTFSPKHSKKHLAEMGNVGYGSILSNSFKNEHENFLQIDGHNYTPVPGSPRDAESSVKDDVEVPLSQPLIKTTKFRIQNICCGKEAELMKRELEPRNGIVNVSVNVVGRIGFVRHDFNIITANDIVSILNKLHLGASIMESGSHEDEHKMRKEVITRLGFKCAILVVLLGLFIAVIIASAKEHFWLKWVAIVEIVVGILPILRKIVLNWMKKVFIDINMLMMIAVVGTIALREWLEGATLVFIFAIAEVLQQYCGYKVQSAISGIMVKLPDNAVLAETGKSVPIDEVKIGTMIVVCAGEKIALDGDVVKGHASVDESSVTGEAVPIEKGPGSKTYSGTIVQSGYLEIVTTSDAQTSTISKVTQMVQEAQAKASQTEKLMNKFAKVYTPMVLITALLVFAIPAVLAELKVGNYETQLHSWGIRALIILLIACPCALVMSVPMPMVCGIAAAAKNGALVKSGTDMEALAKIETIAFDKTGTLTEGRFKVVEIKEFRYDMKYKEILKLVAALEIKSSHPVAAALVNHYAGCITDKIANFGANVGLPDVTSFTSMVGLGLTGSVSGHSIVVGNIKILRHFSISVSRDAERLFKLWSSRGQTVTFCSIDRQLSLMIGLADTPRATAKLTIDILKELGISTVILTGDCSGAAAAAMKATGAENYIAGMKPEHKLEWIRNCQRPSPKTRTKVAMVGDGVNDGPSLAAADVGIAIGACATALAIESAGVALITDSLTKIPELLGLSQFTRRIVIQNIGLALAIKVAVLIATMTGNLALWVAVLSDVAALLLVILNGLRPLFWKRDDRKEAGQPKVDVIDTLDDDSDDEEEDGLALIEIKS